jgi:hypothetical protein
MIEPWKAAGRMDEVARCRSAGEAIIERLRAACGDTNGG